MRGWRLFWVLTTAVCVAGGAATAQQQGRGGRGRGGGPGQGGVEITPGEECPAGMTEVRRGRCQKPELTPPSIVDYRPKSTVVAPEHLVPRAKFPVVDSHSHLQITSENIERTVKEMDALNLRVLVNLSGGSGEALKRRVDTIRGSKYADRFRVFANVNWDGAGGPGWKEREVAGLEQAIKDGAVGLKVFKDLGLSARKASGDHPHGGPCSVFRDDRSEERTMARACAVPPSSVPAGPVFEFRRTDG